MRDGRYELDQWLMMVKHAELIPYGSSMLELGTGKCLEHFAMFHDKYTFQPTDHIIDKWNANVPTIQPLDAENFDESDLIRAFPLWDSILASQLLEHVRFPGRVVAEAYNHLKVGGYFIVTVPFWYRIHESSQNDPEICEENMYDFWRITPSGLKLLFGMAGFERFHVTPLRKPENYEHQPAFVAGWAQRLRDDPMHQVLDSDCIAEWSVELPPDWREQQARLEADFAEWKENPNVQI